MKKTMMVLVAATVALGFAPGSAWATLEIQKQAKTAGVTVANCMDCHTVKMPKKGAADLNDKGKWLVAQKDTKKAAKIDGAWLKDYKK